MERTPRPSLAIEPPNKFVEKRLVLFVKQKREIPPRIGTVLVSSSLLRFCLIKHKN
jgi:hypothetical protein